jgi:hypothetical protein
MRIYMNKLKRSGDYTHIIFKLLDVALINYCKFLNKNKRLKEYYNDYFDLYIDARHKKSKI